MSGRSARRWLRATGVAGLGLLLFSGWALSAEGQEAPPPASVGVVDAQPLRPGDIVRLRIWREPDFSGDFPVESNGIAVLPHIGDVAVHGETSETLRLKLLKGYSEILQNPSISITVLRRIQVLGAVTKPGLYPVDATMTVSDAIALAGGPTPSGKSDKAVLVRDGQRMTTTLQAGATLGSSQVRSGDQIFVPQQSRWANERMFYTAVGAGISVLLAFIRYR
jgi:protein involved in polysaccharide export with SLBB domain